MKSHWYPNSGEIFLIADLKDAGNRWFFGACLGSRHFALCYDRLSGYTTSDFSKGAFR
jgi:hypothetical protein